MSSTTIGEASMRAVVAVVCWDESSGLCVVHGLHDCYNSLDTGYDDTLLLSWFSEESDPHPRSPAEAYRTPSA